MRKLLLSGVLIAWSAPALAIEPGFLMETDFFKWPDWHENLELYDCTQHIWYFILNAPPVVEPPPIDIVNPPVEPPPYVPPPYTPPVIIPPVTPPVVAVPETSTWMMLFAGFAMMGMAGLRRARVARSLA